MACHVKNAWDGDDPPDNDDPDYPHPTEGYDEPEERPKGTANARELAYAERVFERAVRRTR